MMLELTDDRRGIYLCIYLPVYIFTQDPKKKWTLSEAACDGLAASMLVTILLDFWRIGFGSIHSEGTAGSSAGLPWMAK